MVVDQRVPYPLCVSHKRIDLSFEQESNFSPPGRNRTHDTNRLWPFSVLRHSKLEQSHNLTLVSLEHEANLNRNGKEGEIQMCYGQYKCDTSSSGESRRWWKMVSMGKATLTIYQLNRSQYHGLQLCALSGSWLKCHHFHIPTTKKRDDGIKTQG